MNIASELDMDNVQTAVFITLPFLDSILYTHIFPDLHDIKKKTE